MDISAAKRKEMWLGHANEPVILSKLNEFLCEISGTNIALTSLLEIGIVVQREIEWLAQMKLSP